jgi:diguanylate cyclase (GGDEF)-like protein
MADPRTMNQPRHQVDETISRDPATLVGPAPGARPVHHDEWALIRYIGHPIGEVIPLPSRGLRIGRTAENDLCLPEAEVSRRHAVLEPVPQEDGSVSVLLHDNGSTNGTYVNGQRVEPKATQRLENGDVIRVGPHAFKAKRLDELERDYHQAVLAQTTVDPLTGVSNRATVLTYLEKHFDLARRHGRPLTVLLCDLDHFKRVNDTYGHAAGDRVLQVFGGLVLGRLRGSDQVGRIGGEEFLVVLPETQSGEALTVADNLRGALTAEPIPIPGGAPILVTCSLGAAQVQDGDPDAGSLLARADAALYRAKAQGRNRVELDAPRA